jgi:hypothetical protein
LDEPDGSFLTGTERETSHSPEDLEALRDRAGVLSIASTAATSCAAASDSRKNECSCLSVDFSIHDNHTGSCLLGSRAVHSARTNTKPSFAKRVEIIPALRRETRTIESIPFLKETEKKGDSRRMVFSHIVERTGAFDERLRLAVRGGAGFTCTISLPLKPAGLGQGRALKSKSAPVGLAWPSQGQL